MYQRHCNVYDVIWDEILGKTVEWKQFPQIFFYVGC